jgi:hypothetical protein
LREKGSGYLIICGDLRHFPVDALMQPSPHDNMDTGLGCLKTPFRGQMR